MKTLLEILTDPHPSERDRFILSTARAIVLRNPKTATGDYAAIGRALCAAIRHKLYDVPLAPKAYGTLFQKIAEACAYYRRFEV